VKNSALRESQWKKIQMSTAPRRVNAFGKSSLKNNQNPELETLLENESIEYSLTDQGYCLNGSSGGYAKTKKHAKEMAHERGGDYFAQLFDPFEGKLRHFPDEEFEYVFEARFLMNWDSERCTHRLDNETIESLQQQAIETGKDIEELYIGEVNHD
jgi:hypothetical protein